LTIGATVSVDPVTATLPVVPGSVHSGVPPVAGTADGHDEVFVTVVGLGSATTDELLAATEEESGEAPASEPQAASNMTSDAVHATNATEADVRDEFTVATLQPPQSSRTSLTAD
jgi:hypothetical protein